MSDQEPFEVMLRRMCASVMREIEPQVVEAEQAIKQARAELRDRFAIAALSGLLAAGDHHAYNRNETAIAAAEAWKHADAMMKARDHE